MKVMVLPALEVGTRLNARPGASGSSGSLWWGRMSHRASRWSWWPCSHLTSPVYRVARIERPMRKGQTTPYLDMLRARIPSVRIEIIEDTGHFPQIDESGETNALLDSFLASLGAS